MEKLQKAAHEAITSTSSDEKRNSLAKAFEIFSTETLRLEKAYDSLNEQFQTLNLELQDTNHKLHNKVAELDVITDYLRSVLDNIVQGILFIDFNGIIITYNPAAEAILGISSSKAKLHRFWDNFADDAFGFSMQEALQKKIVSSQSTSYINRDHYPCELEITTAFAIKKSIMGAKDQKTLKQDTPYHMQGMIVMIRDITEVRHLQIQAARADRMKVLGEMAAQVAHEIRNPLGGIKGYASLLQRDLADMPSLQQMASHIVEGTDNLNRLVSQVLSFARPVQPHLEKINLVSILTEIKQHVLADSNLMAKKIEITIDACHDELYYFADPALLKSAILNLVVNSIQAMPDGGEITMAIKETKALVIISISDTGTGISEDHMSRLFMPFFTTKTEGNGLGLTEVQKVVQAHGGTIDARSVFGRGTTFAIKLPKNSKFQTKTKEVK